MIHNDRPQVTFAVFLCLHLKPREKTKSRFDKFESRPRVKLLITLFGGLRGSNVGVS